MSKINSIEKIAGLVKGKVVHCHGCMDMCHLGHILHLEAAKTLGSVLVVTVTSDMYVSKGTSRPIFTAEERALAISKLECVDYVCINDAPDACEAIKILKPDIYAKGQDYKNISCEEFEIVEMMGGKVVFTDTPKYSTTEIIERCKKA